MDGGGIEQRRRASAASGSQGEETARGKSKEMDRRAVLGGLLVGGAAVAGGAGGFEAGEKFAAVRPLAETGYKPPFEEQSTGITRFQIGLRDVIEERYKGIILFDPRDGALLIKNEQGKALLQISALGPNDGITVSVYFNPFLNSMCFDYTDTRRNVYRVTLSRELEPPGRLQAVGEPLTMEQAKENE